MRPFLLALLCLLTLPVQGCDRSDVAALFLGKPGDAGKIEANLAREMPLLLTALEKVRASATPSGRAAGDTRGRGLSLNRIKRAASVAQRHMDAVSDDLDQLLRAQDAEIAALYALLHENRIETAVFDARIRSMRNQRDLLARALEVGIGHVEAAQRQMHRHGKTGTKRERRTLQDLVTLEEEAEAARLALSLL